jgi:Dolichyl-phosphate-mannose-protein mannosyltransferase
LASPDFPLPEAASENASRIIGNQPSWTNEDLIARGAVAVIFIFFTVYTWARWGDLQIDCGREVYVPIEILKGRMLYRDLWYPYGPLVPYLQALLVWCFGAHLNTFYCFGLFLNLSIAYLVYSLARRLIPPIAAVVVSIVCLRQGFSEGLFNYIFPYSYSAVVGLLLTLLCMYSLFRYVDTRVDRKLVLAGLAGGLALLCKQEFGAAAMSAIGFIIAWDFIEHRSFVRSFRQVSMIAPGLLLAVLVYGWFFWQLTPDFMLRENFALSPNSPFMKIVGPRWIAQQGFRFIPREMFATFASVVFSLAIWFLGAWFLSGTVRRSWVIPVIACFLILVLIGGASSYQPAQIPYYLSYLVIFPIGMYWIAPIILIGAIASLPYGLDRETRCIVGLLAAFGMALASRVMFVVVRAGYPVFYDPPLFILFMMAVTAVLWYGAKRLSRPDRLHLINCFLAMDAIWFLLAPSIHHSTYKSAPVATPIGTSYSRPAEALLVPQMVSFVRAQGAAGKRVLILPEFPMLYVMGGMEAPSRWYELVPGMLDGADEYQFISDAESQHVEYVVITNRSTFEYGYPYFGVDWGKEIYNWINGNFEQSGEFGKFERRIDAPFAALLYKRRVVPGQGHRNRELNR